MSKSGKALSPFAGRYRRNEKVSFPGRGNGGIGTVDILPPFTGTVPRMLLFQPEPSHVYKPFSGGAVHAGRVRNVTGMSFPGSHVDVAACGFGGLVALTVCRM